MKTKNLLLGLALSTLTLQSCNVLDIDPTDTYSESTAYASIKNLDLYVKSFYNVFYSNADINVGANLAMDDGVSDLIKYSWFNVAEGSVNKLFYYDNMMSPDANYRSNWDDMYEQIRRFNEYFYDVHSGFADNLDSDQLAIRTAEVRFMRAFAYQELVLRHGGVILRINEDRVDDHNQRAKARSSEEDCWTFILDEYEKAAQILPEEWTGSEAGRLTKGAAYGMKARAALYAKRWQDAVNAALEVEKLEKKGVYQLLSGTSKDSYMQIFNTVNNKELILPVYFQQKTKQHMFNHFFCPPYDTEKAGLQPGTLGAAATPTDEYASAFDIKVGKDWKSFDWTHLNEYSEGPWGNRDPRFYASILYNGANWTGRQLELYVGGKDGYMDFSTSASQDYVRTSTTGYIFRKFMDEEFPECALLSEWGEPGRSLRGGFHMDFLLHFGPSHYLDLFRVEEPYFSRRGKGDISEFVKTYEENYAATNREGLICIPSGNHDMVRIKETLDDEEIKIAFAFLLSVPGAPFIYYGDEIGMKYLSGIKSVEGGFNRTGSRSPMQWDHSANAGFSSCKPEELYIQIDPDEDRPTAEDALAGKNSLYDEVKKLIAVRKEHQALQNTAPMEFVYVKESAYPLVYKRTGKDETIYIVLNPSGQDVECDAQIPQHAQSVYSNNGEAAYADGKWKVPAASATFLKVEN